MLPKSKLNWYTVLYECMIVPNRDIMRNSMVLSNCTFVSNRHVTRIRLIIIIKSYD